MAEVIDSLLVRLGLESDEKDFREASAMFDNVRRSALQFGAVIGAGLGVQNLTFGFARAKDELGKFADTYGTTAQFVDSLGYALDQSGGSARDAFGSIKRIRDLLEATEWGEVSSEAFRVAGFDPYMLQGVTDVAEAYERLAEATQGLSTEEARRALSSLGFGDAEIQLFRQGPDGLKRLLEESESYARVTEEMTDQAARFSTSLTNLSKAAEGVSNEFSALILDDFSDTMQAAADFLRENRGEIASFFEKALPYLEATAAGVVALVAAQGTGKAADFLARGGLASLIARAGPLAAGALAYQYTQERPGEMGLALEQTNAAVGRAVRGIGEDRVKALLDLPLIGSALGDRVWNRWGDDPLDRMRENATLDEEWVAGNRAAPRPAGPPPSSRTEYNIEVDARGATDPGATAEAAQRGVEQALQRAAENTVNDLRTPAQ